MTDSRTDRLPPSAATFETIAADADKLALVQPRLRYAKIKPTDDCNSRCITCDYWRTKHDGEMDLAEILGVLADLRAQGVEELIFTGGEPTLRKDLTDMVAEARRLGFRSIGLTTNSLSLNTKKIDALLEAGLTEVVLSLEGLDLHDEIRGVPGNTAKVVRNLEHFAARRDEGAYPDIGIRIGMTLMGKNLHEVPGVIDLARCHGATLFFNLIDRGAYFFRGIEGSLFDIEDWDAFDGLVDSLIDLKLGEPDLIGNSLSSLDYARRYFRDPKQAEIPCYLGYVGIEIDSNADVYSNCWGLPPVGNLRRTPLADILAGPAYAGRCRDMYAKKCPGCSCGYILNLAYHPESVARDLKSLPQRHATGFTGERLQRG